MATISNAKFTADFNTTVNGYVITCSFGVNYNTKTVSNIDSGQVVKEEDGTWQGNFHAYMSGEVSNLSLRISSDILEEAYAEVSAAIAQAITLLKQQLAEEV